MTFIPSTLRLPALVLAALALLAGAGISPLADVKCDADNGGLVLPEGFCATVVAGQLGPVRQLAVAPNGDLYAALSGKPGDDAMALASQPGTDALFAAVHGRDQLSDNRGFSDEVNANNPAEELLRVESVNGPPCSLLTFHVFCCSTRSISETLASITMGRLADGGGGSIA